MLLLRRQTDLEPADFEAIEEGKKSLYALVPVDEPMPGDPDFITPEKWIAQLKKEEARAARLAVLLPKRDYVLSEEGRQSIVVSHKKRKKKGGGGPRRDRSAVDAVLQQLASGGKIRG